MTADATKRPRRLPRFSLRSLILFVALAGSGYGLWARWEPWGRSVVRPTTFRPVINYPGNRAFERYMWRPDVRLDSRRIAICKEPNYVLICKLYPHIKLAQVRLEDDEGQAIPISRVEKLKLIQSGIEFSAIYWVRHSVVEGDYVQIEYMECVYRRRRPEYWYGAAWLPEFWLTVALGVGLVLSLLRDRKLPVAPVACAGKLIGRGRPRPYNRNDVSGTK